MGGGSAGELHGPIVCLWAKVTGEEKNSFGSNKFYLWGSLTGYLEDKEEEGVAARLRVEQTFYSLTSNLEQFRAQWGIRAVLCSLSEEGALVLNF